MRGDPYWMKAKFASTCPRCQAPIKKGEDIFYYPNGKSVLCAADGCGKQGQRDLDSAKFDEGEF
jgi:hypothetical protein